MIQTNIAMMKATFLRAQPSRLNQLQSFDVSLLRPTLVNIMHQLPGQGAAERIKPFLQSLLSANTKAAGALGLCSQDDLQQLHAAIEQCVPRQSGPEKTLLKLIREVVEADYFIRFGEE